MAQKYDDSTGNRDREAPNCRELLPRDMNDNPMDHLVNFHIECNPMFEPVLLAVPTWIQSVSNTAHVKIDRKHAIIPPVAMLH